MKWSGDENYLHKLEEIVFLCNVLVLAFKGPTAAPDSSKTERRRGRDMPNLKHILKRIEIKKMRVWVMLADVLHNISSSQTWLEDCTSIRKCWM